MSLIVTADLCIISLGFFEIRFATFERVFVTFFVIVVAIKNLIIILAYSDVGTVPVLQRTQSSFFYIYLDC